MISWASFSTIIGMLCVTYSTRLLGFFLLKNRTLSPRMARTLEAAPACVLLSVIAPHFISHKPHELIALAVTLFMAARFSMLPTVIVAVATSGILGWLMWEGSQSSAHRQPENPFTRCQPSPTRRALLATLRITVFRLPHPSPIHPHHRHDHPRQPHHPSPNHRQH